MTATSVIEAQDVCASDPNFAVIFAFCERFGDSCGVTIPTFQELQEMLEKTNEVPDALIDLHVKLLRRVKKSVHADKWERAILKFCQGYAVPDFWELEHYGYKGISVQLKLRILKTLFEAQFDSNAKFKAEINKLESSSLRSQPLGWDKSGTAYWVQFDRACNLRIYKEDSDEDTWKIVARDRSTLVKLINDLSGAKDNSLDDIDDSNSIETSSDAEVELSPGLDQEKYSPTSLNQSQITENNKSEFISNKSIGESEIIDEIDSRKFSLENPINLKRKQDGYFSEQNSDYPVNYSNNKTDVPIVGETIEEFVMIVRGEGSGKECDTGNPDEVTTPNETTKNEDIKKPKLWSIETICSSSKDVREEIISVPKTGFFFGDDSVPCFNNISNNENSHLDKKKLEIGLSNENNEDELETSNKLISLNEEYSSKKEEELSSKQSVFNIKVHEEEVQITEQSASKVFTKAEYIVNDDTQGTNICESLTIDMLSKSQIPKLNLPQVFENDDKNKLFIKETVKNSTAIIVPQNKTEENNLNSFDEKVECKKDNLSDKKIMNPTNSTINDNRQNIDQNDLSTKSKENRENETKEQLLSNQQLTSGIIDQAIKIDEQLFDDNIQISKQSTSEINQSNEVEKLDIRERKIINDLLENSEDQSYKANEQKCVLDYDTVEQNSCILDTKLSTVIDSSIKINNQNVFNSSNDIDKESIRNSDFEENTDKQPYEGVCDYFQTPDDSVNNITCSNDNLNQYTKNENSSIIDYNSSSSSSNVNEGFDQIISDKVLQCTKACKQIDEDHSHVKHKNTSHNISSIIESDDKTIEQSVNIVIDESIKLENCEIKNESINSSMNKVLEKKGELVVNVDCKVVSNNKHSLDKILQKSNQITDSLSHNFEKKTIKELNKIIKPEFSIIEVSKVDVIQSETSIKEFELKNVEVSNSLIVIRKDEQLEDKKNIELLMSSSVVNQEEIINTMEQVSKRDINDDDILKIPIDQSNEEEKIDNLEINFTEIKPIIEKKELIKCEHKEEKLLSTMSDTDDNVEKKSNELKNIYCSKENLQDLSVHVDSQELKVPIVKNEENIDKTILEDECVTYKLLNNDSFENDVKEVIYSKDSKTIGIVERKIDLKEPENLLKTFKNQTVTSPLYKDVYESENEANENILIKSPKEEFDNSEVFHHSVEENKISEEEEEVVEEVPKKKGRPARKKGKRGRAKKNTTIKQENKNNAEEKVKKPYKPRKKKVVTIAEEVTIFPEIIGEENKRRSRRIAEIKIKEQFIPSTQYDDFEIPLKSPKKKDKGGKKGFNSSKKMVNVEESDEDEDDPFSKKLKKRKKKGKSDSLKKINVKNPWNVDSDSSSSENNVELFEEYDHEEEDEIPRPGIEPNVSDHEFSPESDINDDDEEYLPEKRARTAHKKDQDEHLKDDMPCQKCNKSDQPEWILLCDTCNQGWHASCLRPTLMVIPDGDWYCPPCRHEALLNALKDTLKRYDGESKKRENEELRRKRLAYVGISLQNVISSKTEEVKPKIQPVVHESSEDDEEDSGSESYDSEPLYQLRARRQANVSYRFNDYDDMINEAILEESGIDESANKKSIELKTDKNDNDEKTDSDNDGNYREDSPIAPALLHLRGRKKSKKLTNLDISSDDGSDEDFKGPSDEDDDYEDDMSEYSDDSVKRKPQPTRRSVRNRKTVVDPDFINDDSSEESDHRSKKKRSRPWSDSSNSEEEDLTWGKKKKKRTNMSSTSTSLFKHSRGSKRKHNEKSNLSKSKKSKIKYGMDSDSESDGQPKRRTRGRQITYVESDDSEEEIQTKKRKVTSDDEDEYVLNDEELDAENEDHNLEVDEDTVVSNEGNEDELDDEEEGVDDEEEDIEEEVKNKPVVTSPSKLPPLNVQTTINREPIVIAPVASGLTIPDFLHNPLHQNVHQRLLPPTTVGTAEADNQHCVISPNLLPDKRKRPSHQLKKSPSPNHPVDYGGSSYPYSPDATKVVSTVPPVHVAYTRPILRAGPPITAAFKPMATVPPSSGFPVAAASYRMANNKIAATAVSAPPAYMPPQVQQDVYTTSTNNYSPYPIDYATAGAPLPPPPPTIAFRNVVGTPSPHEIPVMTTVATTQQLSTVTSSAVGGAGGDSEFGGLVSYFSSQQEDDFDA